MIRDPKIKDIRAVADSVEALDFTTWFPYSKITVEDKRSFADDGYTIYLYIDDIAGIRLIRRHGGLKVQADIYSPGFLEVNMGHWYRQDSLWIGTYKDVAQRAVGLYAEAVDIYIEKLSQITDPQGHHVRQLEILWRIKLGQPQVR